MNNKGLSLFLFWVGVAAVGTSLTLPGRQTAQIVSSTGTAASSLLGTAITGK